MGVHRRTGLLAIMVALFLGAGVVDSRAAETKPKVELAILQPATKAELSGTVEVKVEVKPAGVIPSDMYVGLGGPPFARMVRVRETNQWIGKLDTTLAPNGDIHLLVMAVTPVARRVERKLPVKLENPLRPYFGDIHAHTYYSDGAWLPLDALTFARKIAKLDFLILTDHARDIDDREWADTREQVWKANEDGVFVAIPGIEWEPKGGHCCLFDPPGLTWPDDLPSLYQAARETGVIGQFNHPGPSFGDFGAFAYSEPGDEAMQLVEVRGEGEQQYYIQALNNGWHLAPAGTDDTHSGNWGNRGRWTGLLAPGLSRLNVWTALKSRHCYSTLDRNCWLDFRVNDAVMGDVIAQPVAAAKAVVTVSDPDRKDLTARMELFEDGKVVQSVEPQAGRCHWESASLTKPGKHYYFLKVTQADDQKLWSAPVWVTVTEQ